MTSSGDKGDFWGASNVLFFFLSEWRLQGCEFLVKTDQARHLQYLHFPLHLLYFNRNLFLKDATEVCFLAVRDTVVYG